MSLDRSVSVGLGEATARGSRQQWRRSSVTALGDGGFAVGTADGTIRSLDADGRERWRAPGEEMAVALTEFAGGERTDGSRTSSDRRSDGGVAVGTRGDRGRIRLLDGDGSERWRYDTADDLGGPAKESLFWYPFVVDMVADGPVEGDDASDGTAEGRLYVAARRYERDGDERVWNSAVYAFGPDGGVRWRYETDASPIALSLGDRQSSSDDDDRAKRLAVAYNRCGGDHDRGLVVLDAESGTPVSDWDPETDGERRVGDASLSGGVVAAASHGDYRGYALDAERAEQRWAADLGVEREVGEETLYAYPNHVHLADEVALFVTGNTFPEEGREAEGRHPNEHTIAALGREGGERLWTAPVGGFVAELSASDGRVAVPCAQHFRDRDAEAHALRVFDAREGPAREVAAEGIVTAAALSGDRVAFVEEPVEYHDEGEVRGEYRLRIEAV
ncbi:transcriptional regulator [Halorussus sp. MSC15.2]|uniref:transcriptional regulator n=1 Tax=Halorussus sp. MSC15.2 TaxID=2283638 RepID=UPI0013D419D4|nr:transcriptional regulator [Halorussus sp. MSC15.2]NEU58217.1 transcriptional regulator [Halorussus sp. MSC15.2]